MIAPRAASLLVAVALLYAGVGGLVGAKPPAIGENWKIGAFPTAAILVFLVEFGDKTQFLTAVIAARYDSLALTAAGATAGAVASLIPAVLLGDRLGVVLPMKALRIGIAAAFLLAGFLAGIAALRLI